MEITLKNYEIRNTMEVLNSISATPMSVSASFKLMKIAKALEPHLQDFVTKQRELIQTHAKKDENGELVHGDGQDGNPDKNLVVLTDPTKYANDSNELVNQEVTVQVPVTLEMYDLIDGPKLTMQQMAFLEKLFTPEV